MNDDWRILDETCRMTAAALLPLLTSSSSAVLDDQRAFAIDDLIKQGLPIEVAIKLLDSREVPPQVRHRMLGSSLRTLQRKVAAGTSLSAAEGANLIEAIRLIDRATEVLGSRTDALAWLVAEIRSLNGRRPIELLESPIGRREVERVLGRIEHGVY